jgi:hypothetical protein
VGYQTDIRHMAAGKCEFCGADLNVRS